MLNSPLNLACVLPLMPFVLAGGVLTFGTIGLRLRVTRCWDL